MKFPRRFESCNVIFRTAALRESGGFDEEIGHYWEDTAAGYAVMAPIVAEAIAKSKLPPSKKPR